MKKEVVTNLISLRKVCKKVEDRENIKSIISDLRDSFDEKTGFGLSANQIGYDKRVSVIRLPHRDEKTQKDSIEELILINPKVIQKFQPFRNVGEGCLSIPRLRVDTFRYNFVIVSYLDKDMQPKQTMAAGLKAIVLQHEIDHLNGKTIIDKKYRNTRT